MRIVPSVLSILVATLLCTVISAQPPKLEVLFEEGFEDTALGELPEGWKPFSAAAGGGEVSADRARTGDRSLLIVDDSDAGAPGPRSTRVDVITGEWYCVEGWYWAEEGNRMSLYMEFWDAAGERMNDYTRTFGVSGCAAWVKASGTELAPEGAVSVSVLPYSHSQNIATGYWDDLFIARGIPVLFDRTPRPPAPVEHPCGLYDDDDIERAKQNVERHDWARERLDSMQGGAQFWVDLTDDQLVEWIPEGTPFRVCDCPNCGASWGVGPFASAGEGRFKCRRCDTVYPNADFPENGVEKLLTPLGTEQINTFYEDDQGKKYRLSGHARYRRVLKLSSLGSAGRMFALTGEAQYADAVRRALLRLAAVYPGYVPHDWYKVYPHYNNLQSGKLSGWKLHDAGAMIEMCVAYDLTAESDVYSDEDRSIIEEGVFREAARLITSTAPQGCCINDGPYLMGAGAYFAKLLGEHQYMAWALEPPNGFFGFIEHNFWRDGHWEDGSPAYESMALSKFHVLPEIAHGYTDPPEYTGLDRYDDLDMFSHPLMSKVYTAGLYNTLPNGRSPANNDSHYRNVHAPRFTETNYQWFPTERNLRLLSHAYGGRSDLGGDSHMLFRRDPDLDLSAVEPLDLSATSMVRPALGWAIMRNGQRPASTMLLFDFGLVRGHAHPDKLNVQLYARGREIVPDQGYLSARHHYQPWLRSTACHNVVLVDGEAQRLSPGELLSFIDGGIAQSATAQAPGAYPGVVSRYERTVVLMTPEPDPPYMVDVFRVSGGERHVMAFHGDGQTFASPLSFAAWDGQLVSDAAGAKWLRDLQRADAAAPFTASWGMDEDQPAHTRLTVLDPAVTAAWHATAPGQRDHKKPWDELTMHMLYREQPGPDSVFVSVTEAVVDQPALSAIERLDCSDPSVIGVRVTRPGGVDYLFIGDEASAASEVTCSALPGLRFTGRQAVVTIADGQVAFAQLVDGTSLVLDDFSLESAGPIRGTIVAFDDEADTFTLDAPLPAGEALAGRQLLVSGRTDGAYQIARVSAADGRSLVHLAEEPIMHVAEGDTFVVPSVVQARRLDDGTFAHRAD